MSNAAHVGRHRHARRDGRQYGRQSMRYMLMIFGNEANMMKATPADATQMSSAYGAYTQAMQAAGVLEGGERLRPTTTATTVRVADGKSQVLDGPYAEAKE